MVASKILCNEPVFNRVIAGLCWYQDFKHHMHFCALLLVRLIAPISLNRRIEADRKAKADPEAVNRRATDAQVIEDVEQLVTA
jgi:hypothetical protein